MAGVAPYVPGFYLPGNLGRYRSYPRAVIARIPGTGYQVGKLVWGEQVLDLDGNAQRYPYGRYGSVPLRGIGGYVGLGQADPQPASPGIVGPPVDPAPSAMLPMRFLGIARRIWMEPPPAVSYGPGQTLVQYPGAQPAINYEALVEYAKITAVGTFIGIPLAWWWAKRRAKVTPNRWRRRRRR